MKLKLLTLVAVLSAFLVPGTFAAEKKMGMEKMAEMPFGGMEDIAYAKMLWMKIEKKGLNSTPSNLYIGGKPHGAVREVLEAIIDGKRVIVKRNYGGEGVSLQNVANDRAKYLKAVTVMAKREKGYDSKNNDWFWVKYKADGSLHTNPKGVKLAGLIDKTQKRKGCIACHNSASGGDLVFKHNKEANADVVYIK